MAKQEVEKEKVETHAQGTEGATETKVAKETESTVTVDTTETSDVVEELVPEWAVKLLESNQAVIESNEKVVASIDEFKEGATDLVEDIVKLHQEGVKEPIISLPKERKTDVKVKPKAKYIVRKGRKFINKDNSLIYGAGDNVPKLNANRLQNLLEQGIIEEA